MRLTILKFLILNVGLIIPLLLSAQEETVELVTDRPDQTESSTVVPLRTLQVESGFVMRNDKIDNLTQKLFSYNSTLLRYGLLENLELRLGLEYLGVDIKYIDPDTAYSSSGFSPLYTGFKVKIAEESGRKPEIAFLGGLILPFTANDDFRPEHAAAIMRFSFGHTLSERFSLGYNLGAEWDGESSTPGYFYSLALGIGIFEKLGMFIESYGLIREKSGAMNMLDAGFTYLLLPNFQLDVSGGIGINENAVDNFISFGFSYRIPR